MKNTLITLLFSVFAIIAKAQIEVNVQKDEDIHKDFSSVTWTMGPAFSLKSQKEMMVKYRDINYTYSTHWQYLRIPLKDLDAVLKVIEESKESDKIVEVKLDNGFSLGIAWTNKELGKGRNLTIMVYENGISNNSIAFLPYKKYRKLFYGKEG